MVPRRVRQRLVVVATSTVLFVSMGAAWNITFPSGLHVNNSNVGTYGSGPAGETYRAYVDTPGGDNLGVSALGTVGETGFWSTSVTPEEGLPWANGARKLKLKSVPGYVVQDTHDIEFF